jgi:hypothetical protein
MLLSVDAAGDTAEDTASLAGTGLEHDKRLERADATCFTQAPVRASSSCDR